MITFDDGKTRIKRNYPSVLAILFSLRLTARGSDGEGPEGHAE
ncbi:hypothetical protein [Cupriavidus necator]|nr:hypothetical protein [Cupriavidus necator]